MNQEQETRGAEARQARQEARAATYRDRVAGLRALNADATTDHCSHGVPRACCKDHRTTTAREGQTETNEGAIK